MLISIWMEKIGLYLDYAIERVNERGLRMACYSTWHCHDKKFYSTISLTLIGKTAVMLVHQSLAPIQN